MGRAVSIQQLPQVLAAVPLEEPIWADKVDIEVYHSLPGISSTIVREARRTPMHAKHLMETPMLPTPSMALGTAVHDALLSPEVFATYTIVDTSSRRTKAWEEAGTPKLTVAENELVVAMRDAVMAHDMARTLLTTEMRERSMWWQDGATGILCKIRPDAVWNDVLVDLKTTSDASFHAMRHKVLQMGYHIQLAMYQAGLWEVMRINARSLLIIAVENEPPHGVALYQLDESMVATGRQQMWDGLGALVQPLNNGVWPGYPEEIKTISLIQ